jgi:hypothetical protein
VYKKALEIVNEGKSWGSLRLEGFEGRVEVDGRERVVKVVGWGAEIVESQSGKKLLRPKNNGGGGPRGGRAHDCGPRGA